MTLLARRGIIATTHRINVLAAADVGFREMSPQDVLQLGKNSRAIVGTGMSFSETLVKSLARGISSTGLSVSDSQVKKLVRQLADTGAAVSDSMVLTGGGGSGTLAPAGVIYYAGAGPDIGSQESTLTSVGGGGGGGGGGAYQFGKTSIGGTSGGALAANIKRANRVQATVTSTAASVAIYMGLATGTANAMTPFRLGIWADSAGAPGALLGVTAERLMFQAVDTAGWVTLPLLSGVALTAGTYYWLMLWTGPSLLAGVDRFNRANGTIIGSGQWAAPAWPGYLTPAISGNQLAGVVFPSAYWNATLTNAPFFVQAKIVNEGANNSHLYLVSSGVGTSALNGYLLNVTGTSSLQIGKSVAGSFTTLTSVTASGPYFRLQADGAGNVEAYTSPDGIAWTRVATVSDSTYLSGFLAGFDGNGSTTGPVIDDFACGGLGTATGAFGYAYDSVATTRYFNSEPYSSGNNPVSPYGTPSTDDNQFSIYVNAS